MTNSVNVGIVTHEDVRQPVQLVVLIQESKAKERRKGSAIRRAALIVLASHVDGRKCQVPSADL